MQRTRLQRSLRATFLGMVVNTLLIAGKLAAGIAGHSHALVADAVESLADLFSALIVWRGLVISAAPADADHPYGHGKAEPIASALVSGMLLVAAGWIAVTSVREIITPHSSPAPFTLGVLLAVIVIKEGLFRFVLGEANSVESTVVQTDAWHHRSDALSSAAAALGITIALVGGPGYEAADDWAALAAAGLIAWNGWRLLRGALAELMDAMPDPSLETRVREIAQTVPEVIAIEKCRLRKMGYHIFVDMHVHVAPDMTVLRSHALAHRVKDAVREKLPNVYDVLIHIEPARSQPPS